MSRNESSEAPIESTRPAFSFTDWYRRDAWPLLLLRVFIGWAWVDNAQDHFWASQWFGGTGGQFAQIANGAATRQPTYFVDPLYQGFYAAWSCRTWTCGRR